MFASKKCSHSGRTISLSLLGLLPPSRARLRERCKDELVGRKTQQQLVQHTQVPGPLSPGGSPGSVLSTYAYFFKNRKPLKKQLVRCVYAVFVCLICSCSFVFSSLFMFFDMF